MHLSGACVGQRKLPSTHRYLVTSYTCGNADILPCHGDSNRVGSITIHVARLFEYIAPEVIICANVGQDELVVEPLVLVVVVDGAAPLTTEAAATGDILLVVDVLVPLVDAPAAGADVDDVLVLPLLVVVEPLVDVTGDEPLVPTEPT